MVGPVANINKKPAYRDEQRDEIVSLLCEVRRLKEELKELKLKTEEKCKETEALEMMYNEVKDENKKAQRVFDFLSALLKEESDNMK